MKHFSIAAESDLINVVRYLETQSGINVFALVGDLGAGKTALIKSWLRYKKSEDLVSSPTYAIINEYTTPSSIVYHMDLYRLKTVEEALEIGIEEYLDSGHSCLIEWPELIIDLLSLPYLEVKINVLSDQSREVLVRRVS